MPRIRKDFDKSKDNDFLWKNYDEAAGDLNLFFLDKGNTICRMGQYSRVIDTVDNVTKECLR